ncbi:MAG: bile acid:sodium symporter, partial [Dokdonella sp.]|uniref:bile acid:sodium symporter n=1 Tax=Dokdonella sp. TaxID=2291710 RepID=UPI003BB1B294
LARPLIGTWVERRKRLLAVTDRATVLLVVYVAFSASIVEGLWRSVPVSALVALLVVVSVLLMLALVLTTTASRKLGFTREDEIAIVFCGSKKSLASGVPIAMVLFAGNPALGMIVLPVLLYHQIQLMACAVIAQRYARRASIAAPDL